MLTAYSPEPRGTSAMIPTLAQLISWIESRDDINALRFEPKIYATNRFSDKKLLQTIAACNHCSFETARVISAISWGEFQDMGFDLYGELGYRGHILDFVCGLTNLPLQFFNDYVDLKNIAYTVGDLASSQTKREHFALVYNGSIEYAQNIVEALQHFGVKLT